MQADVVKVIPGQVIYYTISGRNGGNVVATNLVLTAELADNTTLSVENSTKGWAETEAGVTFEMADVEPGALFQAVLAVQVDQSMPEDATELAHPTVSGTGADGITFAPDAGGNNIAIETAPTALPSSEEPDISQTLFLPFVFK